MNIITKYFIFLFCVFSIQNAWSANSKSLLKDLNTLGENKFLSPYIKQTSTTSEVSVVQNRFYSRKNKQEILTGFSYGTSNPTYFKSMAASWAYKFYLNPKWSVGFKYSYFVNTLSAAGVQIIKRALKNVQKEPDLATIPDLDFPKSSYVATASWYPSYGKFNLFNKIMYFDLFVSSSAGQIILKNKPSFLLSLSMGSSFWLTKKWTTRVEIQNKLYKESSYTQQHNILTTQLMLSTGYIF